MTLASTAAIILASGRSKRFGPHDKLLTPFRSKPLAAHSAECVAGLPVQSAIAIVPAGNGPLAYLFAGFGITPIFNDAADDGQGASLALGIRTVQDLPVSSALVLLADMPFVTAQHIESLSAVLGDAEAAASRHDGILQPPLLFSRASFPRLTALTGDKGGKAALAALSHVAMQDISALEATDIDTPETLAALSLD